MKINLLHKISLVFCAALLAWWCWSGYLETDLTFFAGLLLAPLVVIVRGGKGNGFYAILAATSMVAGWFLPARTLHFFALAFTALFILEQHFGKLNRLPVLLVIVISALVKNWLVVFGFPIRLELSRAAAGLLAGFGMDARAGGNVIWLNGQEFSVDPACMGLAMVQVSLLFGLFAVAFFERKTGGRIALGWVAFGLFPLIFGLNIVFNLLRILLLVFFGWLPGTVMHEVGGLVGLVVYVFLPIWFLVKTGVIGTRMTRIGRIFTDFLPLKNRKNLAPTIRGKILF